MYCNNCGNQLLDNAAFCTQCGAPTQIQQQQQQQMQPAQQMPIMQQPMQYQQQQSALCCPNCRSTNISVQLVEVGQMTTKKGVGFGGHMNNAARGVTAVATLGVSNLFWKKSKGTNKTKTVNSTIGICQTCGTTFEIEQGKFGSAPGSIIR